MNKKTMFVLMTAMFAVFFVSAVSAHVIVSGKIYSEDFTHPTGDDASVTVTCTIAGSSHSRTTNSLSDGSYGAVFEDSTNECNASAGTVVIEVSASEGNFKGSASEGIIPFGSDHIAVVNVLMNYEAPSSGPSGGSPSRGGSRIKMSPSKALTQDTPTTPTTPVTGDDSGADDSVDTTLDIEDSGEEGGWSGITGAVIGTLGTAGTIVVVVFLVGIVALAIAVSIVRKKKGIE